jgi:hypothetical protein
VSDIASVAVVTITDPEQHAGRAYAPTGPQAHMAEAAQLISTAAGRTITYRHRPRGMDRRQRLRRADRVRPGPALLTTTIASGNGARSTATSRGNLACRRSRSPSFAARTARAG